MLPRANPPGSAVPKRSFLLIAATVGAVVLVAGLSGCPFYLWGTEQLPELLFYDDFNWIDDRDWEFGAEDGYPQNAEHVASRLQAYEWRQYVRTKDSFDGNIEILVEWSVINGDYLTGPQPMFGESDFRVTIDSRDVTAVLNLYETGFDALSIVDATGATIAGPVTMPTLNLTRGYLVVQFIPNGDDAGVTARVSALGLELTAPLSDSGWFQSTRVTLSMSGSWDDPRALEAVYISRW